MVNQTTDKWEELLESGKIRDLGRWGYFGTGVFLTIIGVFATFGNGNVVILMLKSKTLRKKPLNLLLLNMALSDLGISFFGYPPTTASGFAGRYLFSDTICVLQGFCCFTFAQASVNTLIPVSIYRYIAVCKPHLYYRLTPKVTIHIIMMVWAYTLLWTLPPLFGWSSYKHEIFGTSCSIEWNSQHPGDVSYVYALTFSCYALHVAVLSYCYYQVCSKTSTLKLHPTLSVSYEDVVQFKTLKAESKVTRMCIVLVVVLILVWSPYVFVCLWAVYDPDIPVWWTVLPTMFAKTASMINPYIYAATNSSLRKSFKHLWKKNKVFPGRHLTYPTVVTPKAGEVTQGRVQVADIFVVDRTKEGIYIGLSAVNINTGQSTSTLNQHATSMF